LEAAARLADITVIPSQEHEISVSDSLVKSLAEYRRGHFASAAEWARKTLAMPGEDYECDVDANTILSMVYLRSQQTDESRAALENAMKSAQTKLIISRNTYFCWIFHKSLLAHIFLREAVATQKELLGPADPAVAESLDGMSRVLQKLGRFAEAKATRAEALAINQKNWPNEPQKWGVLGYRVDAGEVVFVFEPSAFGVQVATNAQVQVAGGFNQWLEPNNGILSKTGAAWQMQLVSSNHYELHKKLAEFKERQQWGFKFVVNSRQWIGAPIAAAIDVPTDASLNLMLTIPEPPGQSAK
jgi:tetratricopeptide (TPR) repeat protein